MVNIPMMESYLETLAGYIHDEDKLVTYKWLSKELEVHVNVAKIILWRYLQQCSSQDLVATFMLIGNLKAGGMRVEVVRDTDLEKEKEKFEKIISEHVYSLQKSLTRIGLLAGLGGGDSRYSAIKCDKSVLLSDAELASLRWGKAQIVTNDEKTPGDKKNSAAEKKTPVGEEMKFGEKKTGAEKKTGEEKKTPEADKKVNKEDNDSPKTPDGGSTDSKSKDKVKKTSPSAKSKVEKKGVSKKPVQSTKAGFGNLFGKALNQPKSSNSKKPVTLTSTDSPEEKSDKTEISEETPKEGPKVSEVKEETKESKKSKEMKESKETKKSTETTKTHSIVSQKASKKKSGDPSKKKPTRGKKRERSEESGNEAKKRKRIFVASDSSSEGSASDEEDMFESEAEPPNREKSASPSPQAEPNRRKVRKMVDKTFIDEDGFCVTKKVQVYESCSEEEMEVEVIKQPEPEVAKESNNKPSLVKKKQTTLMNFFKKA